MKKITKMIVSMLLLMNTRITHAYAAEETYYVSNENEILEFESEEHYLQCVRDGVIASSDEMPSRTDPYTYVYEDPVYDYTSTYEWLNYHPYTPAWSTASQYVLTSGHTFSGQIQKTHGGWNFTVNASYTNSVSITFPADPSRYSKLGVYGEVYYCRQKVNVYYYNVYQTSYYINWSRVINYYITVVYQ